MMERVSRDDPYYKACLAASTVAGGVAGNIVGSVAAPATAGLSLATLPWGGIAMGFAVGYLACPYLSPLLRPKIENNLRLDEFAVDQALRAMSQYAHVSNSGDAVKLLAMVRSMPRPHRTAPVCTTPGLAAQTLLAQIKTV